MNLLHAGQNRGEVAEGERVRRRVSEAEKQVINGLVPCSMKHPADQLREDPAEPSQGSILLHSGETLLCITTTKRQLQVMQLKKWLK